MKKVALLILGLFFLIGCRTSKNITKVDEGIASSKLFQENSNKKVDFSYLNIRSRINYIENNSSKKANLNMLIHNHKMIWANISFLGFNVARASITPSGVKAYEKINKTYIDSQFKFFNDKLNVDFIDYDIIQNLLLGKPFLPTNPVDYAITVLGSTYKATYLKELTSNINEVQKKYSHSYSFNSNFLLEKVHLKDIESKDEITITYTDWEAYNGNWLPKNILLKVTGNKNQEIILENSSYIFEKTKALFKIPADYEKRKDNF